MTYVARLCVLLLALAITPLARGEVLLEEDFSDPGAVSGWQRNTGEWKVEDGSLVGRDCDADAFIARGIRTGDPDWSDYSLSTEVRMVSRGEDWRDGPWIGVRHRGTQKAYTVGFYRRSTYLHKANNGRQTSDDNPVASSPHTIDDDAWHRVRISVSGDLIAVFLDGTCILAVRDEGEADIPPVSGGGIVLCARQYTGSPGTTEIRFRDLTVREQSSLPDAALDLLQQKRDMEQFLTRQQQRGYRDVQKRVMAFYYPWYGTPGVSGSWRHWRGINEEEKTIDSSTHYPEIEPYDSQNRSLMARHIRQAKEHGIDTFIFSWWGEDDFSDRALPAMLDEAHEQDFKLCVYWERIPKRGDSRVEGSVDTLSYLIEEYGNHPAFLRVDGKPVIFAYGRVMGQVAWHQWKPIIEETRARTGHDFVLLADGYGNEDYARLFDGLHIYNPVGWVLEKSREHLRNEAEVRYGDAVELSHRYEKIAGCTIIPGYNDTKIREPGKATGRKNGDIYRILWEEAIRAGADWVVITSWNEWHEGSEIEPSVEYGDLYLELTRRYAHRFKHD